MMTLTWIFLYDPGIMTLPGLFILGFSLFSSGPVMLAAVQEVKSDRPAYLNGIYMMLNFAVGSGMSVIIGMFNDWVGVPWRKHEQRLEVYSRVRMDLEDFFEDPESPQVAPCFVLNAEAKEDVLEQFHELAHIEALWN